MPFDPNWPPLNAEIESAPFRNQFNALKALNDGLQATVDSQQTQITAQQVTIDDLQSNVNDLSLQSGDNAQAIKDLQDRVTALEG